MTVAAGATLRMNGFGTHLGSLAGAGTVDNGSAASSGGLTVGVNHASTTFTGTLADGASGSRPLSLDKSGGGTLTLGGTTGNPHTGGTSVAAGTLLVSKQFGVNAIGGDVGLSGGPLKLGNPERSPGPSDGSP